MDGRRTGRPTERARAAVAGLPAGSAPTRTDEEPRPVPLARLHHYFERSCDERPDAVALECEDAILTYRALDERANRLAHHLLARGVTAGDRVGVLLQRSVHLYVALIGILKTGAGYVPIDPSAPSERIEYIVGDAEPRLVVTDREHALASVPSVVMDVDDWSDRPRTRPDVPLLGDPTCYIIYTSGSSGRPKGVDVPQSCICSYVSFMPDVYGIVPTDRVYQGITPAFDFAVEEIWLTWAKGATLVAGPTDGRRVGRGLAQFLQDHDITVFHTVPTALATLEPPLPKIRLLNAGAEAFPTELLERWSYPGRTIFNTYGPTETTITATLAVLRRGEPVTIGRPLPTYTVTVRDAAGRQLPDGEVGELWISGPGVARGYINRADLTAERFVTEADGTRSYRTGDLGRFTADGNIEYRGRADSEVKIRGHRVELQEIDSVLMEDEAVTTAVTRVLPPDAGGELAAYLVLQRPQEDLVPIRDRLLRHMRGKLSPYMIPAYLEVITEIPTLPSGKADRNALPVPVGPRLVSSDVEQVPPEGPEEEEMARVWEEAFALPAGSLSVEAHFFDDLGGHSLLAATVVSRLRETAQGAQLSVLDLYTHPTVRGLAARAAELTGQAPAEAPDDAAPARPAPPRWWRVTAFGLGQMLWLYSILAVVLLPVAWLYDHNDGDPTVVMVGQLLALFPVSYLLVRWAIPVVGVRLLSRGLTEGTYRLYGSVHLRVWAIGKLVTISPLPTLTGSPWAASYLRLLGARVGDACHVGTAQLQVPRLFTLGDGATVGYGVHLNAAGVAGGVLTLGRITIEDDAVLAAGSVLQGPCAVGAGAILREQSLLRPGERVPDGQTWAGSPARGLPGPTDHVFDLMAACDKAPRGWPRRLYPSFAAGVAFLEVLLLLAMAPLVAVVWWAYFQAGLLAAGVVTALAGGPLFVVTACALVLAGRRFALQDTPVGVHHLRSQLGLEKWLGDKLLEQSLTLTNTLYSTLYTPPWLRALGARVGRGAEVSTISHIDPDLLTIDEQSFVADMASVGSATYCNGHVAFRATEVGRRAFVGNAAFVPSGTHLGDGSLLSVQSVPPPGGVDPGTSWLGSPSFYLPQRERYEGFTERQTYQPPRGRVVGRYLIELVRVTAPASILSTSTFFTLYGISLLAAALPAAAVITLAPAVALTMSVAVVLLVAAIKWAVVGRYRPRVEPLWSWFVRRTELVTGLYEATAVPALLGILTGTPMLGPFLRLFGTRVGRRTLLDTTYLSEFDLVHVGDGVAVGPHASLQTHLFEDRVMKMSTVTLERESSVGGRAVVLYDATVGQGAHLSALSLAMKGERLPAGRTWCGIPAQPSAAPRRTELRR